MRSIALLAVLLCAATFYGAEKDNVTVAQNGNKVTITVTVDVSQEKATLKEMRDLAKGAIQGKIPINKNAPTIEEQEAAEQKYKTSVLERGINALSRAIAALKNTDAQIEVMKQAEIDKINKAAADLKAARVTVPDPE